MSTITALFLDTAASTAALFSSLTSFLDSSVSAKIFVTYASDVAFSSTDFESKIDFSTGVTFCSASNLAASLAADTFLSNPTLSDSDTTIFKAETIAT